MQGHIEVEIYFWISVNKKNGYHTHTHTYSAVQTILFSCQGGSVSNNTTVDQTAAKLWYPEKTIETLLQEQKEYKMTGVMNKQL